MDLPEGAYTVRQKIRFGHSDPAGIVYYPEFFRMFNDLFEDWMEDALGVDFPAQFLSKQRMFPLVHIEADFKNPRLIGQTLDLTLVLTALGRSSISYTIHGHDGGTEILSASCVTCMASKKTRKTIPLPAEMRSKMEDYLVLCQRRRSRNG